MPRCLFLPWNNPTQQFYLFIIFITLEVSAIRVEIYNHQLDLIQMTHQGIKSKIISKNSSIRVAEYSYVGSDLMWSEWVLTVSNSVWATVLNPPSIHARRSWNLWIVMVHEQILGCFQQWIKLSAGNTSQTEARTFSRAACFLQRKSACLCLIGVNWRSMGLHRDKEKHFSSNITSVNK